MGGPSREKPLKLLIPWTHYSNVTIMKKVIIWVCGLIVLGYILLAAAPLIGMIFGGGFDP